MAARLMRDQRFAIARIPRMGENGGARKESFTMLTVRRRRMRIAETP